LNRSVWPDRSDEVNAAERSEKPKQGMMALFVIMMLYASNVTASDSITSEPDESSCHYVSHYSIRIDVPPKQVWDYLIDLRF